MFKFWASLKTNFTRETSTFEAETSASGKMCFGVTFSFMHACQVCALFVACCQRGSKNMTSVFFCSMHNKAILLDSVFVMPRIIKVSERADNPYLDLDYSGHHRNLIQ